MHTWSLLSLFIKVLAILWTVPILFYRCTPVLKSPFLSYMQPVPSLVCPLSHSLIRLLLLFKKNFKKERIVVIFFCNCHIRLYRFLLVFWRWVIFFHSNGISCLLMIVLNHSISVDVGGSSLSLNISALMLSMQGRFLFPLFLTSF